MRPAAASSAWPVCARTGPTSPLQQCHRERRTSHAPVAPASHGSQGAPARTRHSPRSTPPGGVAPIPAWGPRGRAAAAYAAAWTQQGPLRAGHALC